MSYNDVRQEVNNESRNRAEHHAEPWTGEETEILREFWDGTEATLREIAETIGRTVEACRQRYYYPAGQVKDKTTARHVSGWLVGFCSECGKFGDVLCTGVWQACEECQ